MSASPGWAAIAAGAVGLAVLDGIVSRPTSAGNVGGVLSGAGRAVRWFLSPAVPAFSTSTPAASASPPSFKLSSAAGPPVGSTPPGSSAASQPTGSNPAPSTTGGPVYVPSPVGPILEYAV